LGGTQRSHYFPLSGSHGGFFPIFLFCLVTPVTGVFPPFFFFFVGNNFFFFFCLARFPFFFLLFFFCPPWSFWLISGGTCFSSVVVSCARFLVGLFLCFFFFFGFFFLPPPWRGSPFTLVALVGVKPFFRGHFCVFFFFFFSVLFCQFRLGGNPPLELTPTTPPLFFDLFPMVLFNPPPLSLCLCVTPCLSRFFFFFFFFLFPDLCSLGFFFSPLLKSVVQTKIFFLNFRTFCVFSPPRLSLGFFFPTPL